MWCEGLQGEPGPGTHSEKSSHIVSLVVNCLGPAVVPRQPLPQGYLIGGGDRELGNLWTVGSVGLGRLFLLPRGPDMEKRKGHHCGKVQAPELGRQQGCVQEGDSRRWLCRGR